MRVKTRCKGLSADSQAVTRGRRLSSLLREAAKLAGQSASLSELDFKDAADEEELALDYRHRAQALLHEAIQSRAANGFQAFDTVQKGFSRG